MSYIVAHDGINVLWEGCGVSHFSHDQMSADHCYHQQPHCTATIDSKNNSSASVWIGEEEIVVWVNKSDVDIALSFIGWVVVYLIVVQACVY